MQHVIKKKKKRGSWPKISNSPWRYSVVSGDLVLATRMFTDLRAALPVKSIRKRDAGVGRYAHADDFVELGGIEVLDGLAGVAGSQKEIHTESQAAVLEGTDDGCTKLFDWSASAFGIGIGIAKAAGAERLGADVFKFAFGLQAQGQLLNCSQQIKNGARCFGCGQTSGDAAGIGFGKRGEEGS
jgi:hypothetical protein